MKLVEFTRDMRPYSRGGQALLPDELADRLAQNGEAVLLTTPVQPFATSDKPQPAPPPVRKPRLLRRPDLLGQTYLTK